MNRNGIRDDVPPWSFFLPVTLAVIVGVLAAGLIQRAIDAVFAEPAREAPAEATQAVPAVAPPEVAAPTPGIATEPMPMANLPPAPAPVNDAADGSRHPPVAEALPGDTPEKPGERTVARLPGAILARRDGATEACINGTIADRVSNGWEQRLENDAPVPCEEQSALLR